MCAKETKTFLKHHVFDRSIINALFQKIEQRIGYISQPEYSEPNNIDTFGGLLTRQNILDSCQLEESANGVLLDLSMKQNRLGDETNYNSNTIRSICKNLKKREILDKIRKKILDKRRMTATSQNVVQSELVWRPWRY